MHEFNPESGEQPLYISKQFTSSLHPKSGLAIFLKGIGITVEEGENFDLEDLFNKPFLMNIEIKKSQAGNEYATFAGGVSLPSIIPAPEAFNEPFVFELGNFSSEKFEKLPKFIQEDIKESKEYQEMFPTENAEAPAAGAELPS